MRVALLWPLGSMLVAGACSASPAQIDAVTPDTAEAHGKTRIRVTGAGFLGRGPVVGYLGMRSVHGLVVTDDTLITMVAPQSDILGPAALELQFGDGTVLTVPQAIAYVSADGTLPDVNFVPGAIPVPAIEDN